MHCRASCIDCKGISLCTSGRRQMTDTAIDNYGNCAIHPWCHTEKSIWISLPALTGTATTAARRTMFRVVLALYEALYNHRAASHASTQHGLAIPQQMKVCFAHTPQGSASEQTPHHVEQLATTEKQFNQHVKIADLSLLLLATQTAGSPFGTSPVGMPSRCCSRSAIPLQVHANALHSPDPCPCATMPRCHAGHRRPPVLGRIT